MLIVDPAIERNVATPGSDMMQFVESAWTYPVNVEETGPVSMSISCKRAACGKGSVFVVIKTFSCAFELAGDFLVTSLPACSHERQKMMLTTPTT